MLAYRVVWGRVGCGPPVDFLKSKASKWTPGWAECGGENGGQSSGGQRRLKKFWKGRRGRSRRLRGNGHIPDGVARRFVLRAVVGGVGVVVDVI